MTLLDRAYPDLLDAETARLSREAPPGARIEMWSFDPPERRRAAAARLRAAGFEARVASAWKPLVHWLLDERGLDGAASADILCPVATGAPPGRFRIEAHPIREAAPCPVRLADAPPGPGEGVGIAYAVRMPGRPDLLVPAPNAWHAAPCGDRRLSPCGWLRVTAPGGAIAEDRPATGGIEAAFRDIAAALEGLDISGPGPHFGALRIRIEAPLAERAIGVGEERLSLAEALHEDLYFSALEIFARAAGLPRGDRTLRPGRILPEIAASQGPVRARVEIVPRAAPPRRRAPGPDTEIRDPATADSPLSPAAVAHALDGLAEGGETLEVRSQRGRPVRARLLPGRGRSALISGGQHANEPTGIAGALRAGATLAREGRAVALSPLENPDGYALYLDLLRRDPAHMHHAARYTASGADLEYAPRGDENEIRHQVRDRASPWLHVNLHGYPSHEWIRPFTGYIPEGFADWMLPKGFLLILRAWPGWEAEGARVLDAAVDALAGDPEIAALNAEQVARFLAYAEPPFALRRGVPVMTAARADGLFPVTLITEAPDESVRGPLFRLLARAQALAACAAVRSAQDGPDPGPAEPRGPAA